MNSKNVEDAHNWCNVGKLKVHLQVIWWIHHRYSHSPQKDFNSKWCILSTISLTFLTLAFSHGSYLESLVNTFKILPSPCSSLNWYIFYSKDLKEQTDKAGRLMWLDLLEMRDIGQNKTHFMYYISLPLGQVSWHKGYCLLPFSAA